MFRKYNKTIKIIYGSTTGNCEKLAFFTKKLLKNVYETTAVDVATIKNSSQFNFKDENIYILCTSTWGIEPATLQEDFELFWHRCNLISMQDCYFIILALGDKYYPHFAYAATIVTETINTYKGILLKQALKLQDPWENKKEEIELYLNDILLTK